MRWSEKDTGSSVIDRFEQQASKRPDHPAVVADVGELSYGELASLARRLAVELKRREGSDDSAGRVALLLPHEPAILAACLAALRLGHAVISLNPGDPPTRLRQICEVVEPKLLVTTEGYLTLVRTAGIEDRKVVVLSSECDGPVPPSAVKSTDPAFLICTSGSTGLPKIVIQSHRNVLHNVLRYTNGLGIGPEDRIALLASLGGGQGIATAWTALLNGATLCLFSVAEQGVGGLGQWLEDRRITVFDTIPSVLRHFARALNGRTIPEVRIVRLASEAATRSDFDLYRRSFSRDCALASVLGSSETGIVAQALLRFTDSLEDGPLPVGSPAEGVAVGLVGAEGGDGSDGVEVGEIVVRSRYLSEGYWGDEQLTAERFKGAGSQRRFMTGDWAMRSTSGELKVVGRRDTQVKVRGHRLQLEEVEGALLAHPDVAAAAVTALPTQRGDTRLVAYITAADIRVPGSTELRRWLQGVLPAHAIPARFIVLDEIPLNANGKADRQRLSALGPIVGSDTTDLEMATETEKVLAGLWATAFELDGVAFDGTFMELGGDSLLAAEIAAGVSEAFGVDLDLGVFTRDPSISTLADFVDERRVVASSTGATALEPVSRAGPLSFSQSMFWEQEAATADSRFNVAVPFRVSGQLDIEALRESVEHVVRGHEILHTTFHAYAGGAIAIVDKPLPVELPFEDVSGRDDQDAMVETLLETENERRYDLASGPLLHWRLLRISDEEYRLLRFSHHILHDAMSWRIFFAELANTYKALIDGDRARLPKKPPLQYIDYAVWERKSVRRELPRYKADVDWWQRALENPPPPLKLPFARESPEPDAPPGSGVIRFGLPAMVAADLDRLGNASGATFYMTRLAVFVALLAIQTRADDMLIGAPVSTRTRAELRRMIGPFMNYGVMRFQGMEAMTFRDLLAVTRRAVIDVSAHLSVPWQQIMDELRLRDVRLTQVMARFASWSSVTPMRFGGVELEQLPRHCGVTWGFRMVVNRTYEEDRCAVEFDPRFYDDAGIRSFLDGFKALAEAVSVDPDQRLLPLSQSVS